MADLDTEYLHTRKATDDWQQRMLQIVTQSGEGTLEDPATTLAVKGEATPDTTMDVEAVSPTPDPSLPPERSEAEIQQILTEQGQAQPRKEFTVESPEVQAVRQQFSEQLAKFRTGESAVESIGQAGRKVAEAVHPGIVVAGRALGLDEEGADALATGFVEFVAGLPGQDESEYTAGWETALAALPMVGMAIKGGKVAGKAAKKAVGTESQIERQTAKIDDMATDRGPGSSDQAQTPPEPGRVPPAAIVTEDDIGLTNYRFEDSPSGHGRRAVFDSTGKVPEEPGYLYHVSPLDQFPSISRDGLRSGKKSDMQKWEEGQDYFRGKLFASSDLSGIGAVIDAASGVDAWALFRFKDDGKWQKGIEDDLFKNRGKVSPEKLDVWTGTAWVPLISPNPSSPQRGGPSQIVKEFQKAVDILKSERGSVPLGGAPGEKLPGQVPAVVSPHAENFKKNAEDFGFKIDGFLDELTKQRRGPVLSDLKVRELADQTDLTMASLLELPPGTILNPEHTVKARQVFTSGFKRMREAAQAVKASGAAPETVNEMFRSIGEMGVATTKMAGLYAESGRTTRLLNQKYPIQEAAEAMKRDPEFRIADALIQQLYEFFRKAEDASKLNPGGMTVEKFADMVLALKTPEEMAVFAKAITKPGWWDMAMEVWINGLLSGPVTHTTNIISNAATLLWNIPERAVASALSRGAIRPGEAHAMLGGILESFGDAWRLAWKAFKEEESQLGLGKIEAPRKAITADALELTGVAGRAVDYLGNAIRLPGRFLMAGDDFFKSIAFRAELRALAKREAFRAVNESGLTGAEAATKLREIEARILADPPDIIKDAAQEFAAYTTFTRELGETGQKVQALASTPVGRLVLPFVRTPTNIFKFAGERTPFALFSKAVREEIAAGGERRALALAKISLGSMTMAYVATLAANGVITGNGPKDPALREIKRATGWQPNSFKIGDQYISYSRIEPLGSLIGMAADAADLMGQLDEMDAEELASALTVAFARNASSKTFIKGLAETLNAVTSQDVNVVNHYLEKELPTLIPFSSLVKQTRNVTDPMFREVNTILDAFANKVPGFSDTLPPHRNLWGEPVLMEGGLGPDFLSPLYSSTVKDDPVSAELARLQLPIRKPTKSIDGVELTPQEYDAYVRLAGGLPIIGGKTVKARLAELMESALYQRSSEGPDGGKAVLIRQIITDYRDRAKQILQRADLSQQFVGEDFPELRDAVGAARETRRQQFNAPAPGGLTR